MHIIGRLTIPIMCFFIAEGYRHTSNLRRYIHRMICFWLISILPFYLFFGDMYEYRQNIIFDLLLGLCTLTILNASTLKKWQKVLLTAAIFFLSAAVGGWPVMPILFILIFYYVPDFKKQALWICTLTVLLVIFLAVTSSLNQTYHFCHYSWMWYDRLYMLGFMLSLLFLKHYNREKGQTPFTSYFFYIFYPAHFLLLYLVQKMIAGVSAEQIYTCMHLAALFLLLGILIKVVLVKPSKAQMATLMVVFSAIIYTFGFLIEITTISATVCYAAIKVEYLGEVLLITAFTLFIKELCHRKIPIFIYILEILVGTITLWCIFTVEQNHFFYSNIGRDSSGSFSRLSLTYNTGFYLFAVYLAIYCMAGILLCLHTARHCIGIERKRLYCCICGIICPWIPILLRSLGLTGGYEIPSIGIAGSAWFICLALLKYGFFDSVALAGESALRHGNEGILVINTNRQIVYANHFIQELFGQLTEYSNVKDYPVLQDIFTKKKKTLTVNGKVYEMRLEPLMESGYLQGYMLWAINMTEHYKHLMKIEDIAKKDALTGIYNRNVFESELTYYLDNSGSGAMFMLDLDNFKQVNDIYGIRPVMMCSAALVRSLLLFQKMPALPAVSVGMSSACSLSRSPILRNLPELPGRSLQTLRKAFPIRNMQMWLLYRLELRSADLRKMSLRSVMPNSTAEQTEPYIFLRITARIPGIFIRNHNDLSFMTYARKQLIHSASGHIFMRFYRYLPLSSVCRFYVNGFSFDLHVLHGR